MSSWSDPGPDGSQHGQYPSSGYAPPDAGSYVPPEPFGHGTAPLPGPPTSLAPYAAGYAPAPYAGYPAPLPSYYGYPGPPPGPGRPGMIIASATLGFVQSGILLIAAVWLGIASLVVGAVANADDDYSSSSTYDFDGLAHWLVTNTILNIIATALLITGGAMMMGRHRIGAILYLLGTLVNIATFITWLVLHTRVFWFEEFLFVVLPLIGVGLLIGRSWQWLAGDPDGTNPPTG